MGSPGTRLRLPLAAVGVLCVLLLGACSKSGGSSTPAATASGTGTVTVTTACTLLTKAQVAQATANSIAFSKQLSAKHVSTCAFASLSGFAVILSVTNTPAAGLSSNIPGLGNIVAKYSLTPVSGLGDQAYIGPDAVLVRKGNTVFAIAYASVGGGNHEQALKKMATDVLSHL